MRITQTRQVKYLGLHLDTRLTWKQHTKSIIDKIRIKGRHMYWLTNRNSKLSIENKLKIYKTIIKPIWTYVIPLWGTAAMSHIHKLELLQSKIPRTIVNASWYVRNENIRKDLKVPTVKGEIGRYAEKYKERMTSKLADC